MGLTYKKGENMIPYRTIASILFLMTAILLPAKNLEEYKKELSSKKGKDRITLRNKIFQASQEEQCDLSEQWQYACDLIEETQRQNDILEEVNARIIRIIFAYNNDLNDSVYKYAPKDLDLISKTGILAAYYEIWGLLVRTYVYDGNVTTGLQEAERMQSDAMQRKDEGGMGQAYYAMGIAYVNMGMMDKAADCYQKSIQLLLKQAEPPSQIGELFYSLSEVYERTEEYEKLDNMTKQWKAYVDKVCSTNLPDLTPLLAYYKIGCARADLGLNRLDHAEQTLDEARELISPEEHYAFRSWLFYRAKLLILQGHYNEALELNDQQMLMYEGISEASDYLNTLKQRAVIMASTKRFREAAELYSRMYEVTDSVNGFETRKALAEMNTILHVDEIKMQEERQRAQQQRLGIIIIASIIVLSLAIFLFFRIRSAKRLRIAHEKLEETHQELLTAYDQLEETTIAKERIESDLRIARDIQMSMVPSIFPDRPDLDLYASMTPAKEVGGDLYGYALIGDNLYFALGDVSGKGVPASLFMAQATRLFRTLAAQGMMPAEIATSINDALSGEDNERSMFVTMFLGLIDLTTGHLFFCNAGHNPPVLIGDGTTEFIEMIPNVPIGLWPGMEFEGEEIADITNRPLFVYTDGLNEAENRQQEQFSDERLLQILQTTPFESSEKTIELLREEVEKHRDGAEPNDDLTMLCVKVIKNNQ
jgi:serine phosphatase RsbU (regulator of sigma subunit)